MSDISADMESMREADYLLDRLAREYHDEGIGADLYQDALPAMIAVLRNHLDEFVATLGPSSIKQQERMVDEHFPQPPLSDEQREGICRARGGC